MEGASCGWRWTNSATGQESGSISIATRPGVVGLRFSHGGQPVSQDVALVRTACHFGGSRPWFLCPGCARRVAGLFFRFGRFLCRHCGRVAYASQSQDAIGRGWIKQGKLESRLGPNWQRPKGMHRATFGRIFAGLMACEEAREEALCAFLQRHAALLG
ncbi:hypothetical protein HNQ51_001231 [Inhella inkyongensis]|uniref:Transposase zinc-ribbon domain-containing protein n=1 Tax=Inhella inkyongensis TaxID=392593 RepID=A0A840S3C8_9BURK|nr:hypothetical protein [Inhella inkyongensis]MBB5203938.1 hypothetical protein [Inhella inkyongensis]